MVTPLGGDCTGDKRTITSLQMLYCISTQILAINGRKKPIALSVTPGVANVETQSVQHWMQLYFANGIWIELILK